MAQPQKTQDTPAATDETLFVTNNSLRLFDLTRTLPPEEAELKAHAAGLRTVVALKTERLRLLPGVNIVRRSDLEKYGVRYELGEYLDSSLDARRPSPIQDLVVTASAPPTLPEAIQLAKQTVSRPALRAWSKIEKRPVVRQAIEEQLKSRKSKD